MGNVIAQWTHIRCKTKVLEKKPGNLLKAFDTTVNKKAKNLSLYGRKAGAVAHARFPEDTGGSTSSEMFPSPPNAEFGKMGKELRKGKTETRNFSLKETPREVNHNNKEVLEEWGGGNAFLGISKTKKQLQLPNTWAVRDLFQPKLFFNRGVVQFQFKKGGGERPSSSKQC